MNIIKEGNRVTIEGQITKFDDYDVVKNELEMLKIVSSNITVVFRDAQSLLSALIGYLIKIVRVDGVQLEVIAGNHRLYDMLDTLSLTEVFNVRKG